jgi:hypothetical protein
LRIRLVNLEDGIISCGFRKMASLIESLNPETQAYYICTSSYRSFLSAVLGRTGDEGMLSRECIDEIARDLVKADLVGSWCMTGFPT